MKSRSLSKILLLFLSLLLTCVTLAFSKLNVVYANPTSDKSINFGDNGFSKSSAQSLVELISELGASSYNQLNQQLAEGNKEATEFKNAKSIIMGGIEWSIVYVSKADYTANGTETGDIIVTLYMADVNRELMSTYSSGIVSNSTGDAYPTNMYGASYIRSTLVGSNYLTTVGATTLDGIGEINNAWKPFSDNGLSSGTKGAFYDYLATPANMSWQEYISAKGNTCLQYKLSNECWGDLSSETKADGWYANDMNYSIKTGDSLTVYNSWKDDRIWIPARAELGDSSANNGNGLWKTDYVHRKNTGTASSSSPFYDIAWYRSTGVYGGKEVGIMVSAGTGAGKNVENSCAVRPALHLNLKAAALSANLNFDGHDHVFGEWEIVTPATCTTDGVQIRKCTVTGCTLENGIQTEVIPMLGHSWATEFTIDTPATCTTAGSKSKHCTRDGCDGKTEVTTIAAAGHSFATDWTSDENNHWHGSTCGHNVKDGLSAHEWDSGTVTKAATCSEEGERTYTCSVCNSTKTEPISKIAHTEVTDPAVPATCTQTGKTEGKHCGVCNEVLIAQTDIPMLSHAWSTAWSKDGENHWHECTECGTRKDEAAHTFSWVVDTPATVTSTGLKHEECLCGERRNENTVIEILTCGHTDKVHHDRVEATCMTAGNVEYWHCNDCGKDIDGSDLELSTTIIPVDPDAHSFTNYISNNDATCTADGTKTAVCVHGCGEEDVQPDEGSALGHNFGEWVETLAPTFTEDGEKRRDCTRCDHYETQVIPKLSMSVNEITLTLGSEFEYGDEIAPEVSSVYGAPVLTWLDESGAPLTDKPTMPGSYKLKASVAEDLTNGYTAAEKEVSFTIVKRKVTLVIDPVSSEKGDDLVAITATVTSGSIIDGEVPYLLACTPDKDAVGEYPITWTYAEGFDEKYDITCADGVYIVSKKADDPNGGGEIDLPVDINVEFKVTQSSTSGDYSELAGMKRGYWAQLWHRNEDGTLGDEFTDTMNCILTLKIPTEIIEAIRGGEEINRKKIAEGLSVYYVNGNGRLVAVDNFKIAQKEDESWIVKFNYNEKFRAEVVFNVSDYKEQSEPAAGAPWWVWLLVCLGGAAVVGVAVVIIVVAKKKNAAAVVVGGSAYDDAELKERLDKQDEKLDEIKEIVDGGFNDVVDDE